jgi:hypothetical protein
LLPFRALQQQLEAHARAAASPPEVQDNGVVKDPIRRRCLDHCIVRRRTFYWRIERMKVLIAFRQTTRAFSRTTEASRDDVSGFRFRSSCRPLVGALHWRTTKESADEHRMAQTAGTRRMGAWGNTMHRVITLGTSIIRSLCFMQAKMNICAHQYSLWQLVG